MYFLGVGARGDIYLFQGTLALWFGRSGTKLVRDLAKCRRPLTPLEEIYVPPRLAAGTIPGRYHFHMGRYHFHMGRYHFYMGR